MTGPSQRREMAETAVTQRRVSIALACRAFAVSETCFRYSPKLRAENDEIADLLVGLTEARKTWGFGLCFLHLRNLQGRLWNHKRVYRIYCELELNLRIKPRKRLKRDKPDALARRSGPTLWRCLRPRTSPGRWVIPPFLTGCVRRIHAAIFSFCAGVMPPMPLLGRSLL